MFCFEQAFLKYSMKYELIFAGLVIENPIESWLW